MNHLHPDALFQCTSVQELQSFGKYRAVRKAMQDRIGKSLRHYGRGWKDLYQMLEVIRTLGNVQPTAAYFTSEPARYIYALVELDGAYRLKELGILKHHYFNKEKARRWRDQIAKVIHPDVCLHPQASAAFAKLDDLYQEITGA
jgi:hypothetical protein